MSPRSLFTTGQRFPLPNHVTSGEPTIPFYYWSAVSHHHVTSDVTRPIRSQDYRPYEPPLLLMSMMVQVVVKNNTAIHARADERSIREFVTMVMFSRECFKGVLHQNQVKKDSAINTLSVFLDKLCSVHYALKFCPCRLDIIHTIKRGCPISPIIPSVVAKQLSATLDLVFRRSFMFTASISSVFKITLTGQVTMFTIIKKTSTA